MKKSKITGLRYGLAGPRAFWYEIESLARLLWVSGVALSVSGPTSGERKLRTLALALAEAKADPMFFSDVLLRRAGMSSADLEAYLAEATNENPWD